MSADDFKNSEVRRVPPIEYEMLKDQGYMAMYSFIVSWGWKRKQVGEDSDGYPLYRWCRGNYRCEDVYQAASIQRLAMKTTETGVIPEKEI